MKTTCSTVRLTPTSGQTTFTDGTYALLGGFANFETSFKIQKPTNMSSEYFNRVKDYVIELGLEITSEDEQESLLIVEDTSNGIKNMVIDCEDPIVILEQVIMELNDAPPEVYRSLLQKNRDTVHGAFVLDETGKMVIFRDTLQIENLDLNELEGSINALSLLLSEYSTELIEFSKN